MKSRREQLLERIDEFVEKLDEHQSNLLITRGYLENALAANEADRTATAEFQFDVKQFRRALVELADTAPPPAEKT
jgi:hypothetical protein